MDEATARFALPLLAAGQAQKEVTHNEALARVDLALHAAVEAIGTNTPPAAPGEGTSWIVGVAPTGAWSGQAGAIAGWTAGGWRFIAPRTGTAVWSKAGGVPARFVDGTWREGVVAATRVEVGGVAVVGAQQPAVAAPTGGSVVDAEARSALGSVLAALRAHGLIAG